MCFSINLHSNFTIGTKYLYQTIQRSRYLSADLRSIIDKVILNNAYFAHPENIIMCMISDSNDAIRQEGFKKIKEARKLKQKGIRKFIIPPLNFNATSYNCLIDWKNTKVTEPPITMDISDENIEIYSASNNPPKLTFPKFPCHTQAVERHIKLVTDASEKVCGPENRDDYIRSKIASRDAMPKFDCKK